MIIIRTAQITDNAELFVMARNLATSFVPEEAAFEMSLDAILQSPDSYLAIATDGEKIVGYVLGFDHFAFYANGRVSLVEEIIVAEENRGQGVGRLLMEAFEGWAKRRESKLISLSTRRAASFYFALGYEESATYFRKLI
jgi:GNAT superfamily N-acetyltransferase